MSRPLAIATVVAIVLMMCAIGYIYLNRKSPYVWEIILGSIALSLLLGGLTALIQSLYEKGITQTSMVLALVVFGSLTFLVAVMLYLSNTPKSIKEEIPVTYLVSPRTKQLASGLRFSDTSSSQCYMDAARIFKNFGSKSPANAKKFEGLAKSPGQGDFKFAIEFFQDFTEYLLVQYLGTHFTTPETGLTMYRKESAKWLGFPNKTISSDAHPLASISGDFKNNLFYGIKGFHPSGRFELRLPKNTDISLNADGLLSSQLVIRNKFMEIKIGVFFYVGGSQSFGFLSDSALRYGSNKNELSRAFNRYETIIYYDVTFSKWRYAYPEMKHYEEWANDLFAMLQRKFAWGSPPLADEVEVLRRFDKAAQNGND